MKKIFKMCVLMLLIATMLFIAVGCSQSMQSTTVTTQTDATENTTNSEETKTKLSRYVIVSDIGDGYEAGIDYKAEDGRIINTCQYRYVVDRKTKQIFIFDDFQYGAISSRQTFILQPLTESGEYVYYQGDLLE
jgi:hypothetical protein